MAGDRYSELGTAEKSLAEIGINSRSRLDDRRAFVDRVEQRSRTPRFDGNDLGNRSVVERVPKDKRLQFVARKAVRNCVRIQGDAKTGDVRVAVVHDE